MCLSARLEPLLLHGARPQRGIDEVESDERYGLTIGGDFPLGTRHQMAVSFEAHRFLFGRCCKVRGRQLVASSRQMEPC